MTVQLCVVLSPCCERRHEQLGDLAGEGPPKLGAHTGGSQALRVASRGGFGNTAGTSSGSDGSSNKDVKVEVGEKNQDKDLKEKGKDQLAEKEGTKEKEKELLKDSEPKIGAEKEKEVDKGKEKEKELLIGSEKEKEVVTSTSYHTTNNIHLE